MNILPKKSWHVRNKDNVARVRRDEAAAEAERRKRDARALRAEQEVRTELLRKRARAGGRSPSPTASPVLFPPPEEGPNREHEAEKRREQERRERALGVLTYLGQSAAEAQTCPPWYLQPPKRGEGAQGGPHEAQEKRKAVLDPLLDIRKGLGRVPNPKKSPKEKARSPPRAPPEQGGGTGLEELRRQRLAREASEAARSRELLRGLRDPQKPREPQNPPQERQRPYNSQFHPRLARGGPKHT
ncbi:leukocyte receptor cluster member 1 [Catharus ustulatus]|uniref:leukocyte receptor cluster member 1 n=1 Tax=Catharus ustulatus TaxID=91951 RepID=UPI00140A83C6|nr:leukocyte receptor cluster member 1 [Catharus ustulatus]